MADMVDTPAMTDMAAAPDIIGGQTCPICGEKKLTLSEVHRKIPFGDKEILTYLFSMNCSSCKYHKSDVEFEEKSAPVKYTLVVDSEDDMRIMIVKSGEATVKIPNIITMCGGPDANGYITTVEGLLMRARKAIELARDSTEDSAEQKRAKKLLKKITRIMWGQEKQKIVITDKTGNSLILSEKAVKSKL